MDIKKLSYPKMIKKLKELNKRYPDNKYTIKEIKTKTGLTSTIVRTAGTRAHKKKK